MVELRDLGGTREARQQSRLASDPVKVISNSRFLGRLEIPLSETLKLRPGTKHVYTLMRRTALDQVTSLFTLTLVPQPWYWH
jgi:hypothetical protein